MKVVENEVIKELSENCNRNEKIIKIMLEECKKVGYNIEESNHIIFEFYKNNNCPHFDHENKNMKRFNRIS